MGRFPQCLPAHSLLRPGPLPPGPQGFPPMDPSQGRLSCDTLQDGNLFPRRPLSLSAHGGWRSSPRSCACPNPRAETMSCHGMKGLCSVAELRTGDGESVLRSPVYSHGPSKGDVEGQNQRR